MIFIISFIEQIKKLTSNKKSIKSTHKLLFYHNRILLIHKKIWTKNSVMRVTIFLPTK
jgi:hypothetical protein